MSKTIKQIADEIGVSKQAVFKKIRCEPLSTSLQWLTTTVDGRLTVSVDGESLIKQAFAKNKPSTKSEEKPLEVDGRLTVSVDGKTALYEVLKIELQAKNDQIATLQKELSLERQHSREQADKMAMLADQSQKLQFTQMTPSLIASADQKDQQAHNNNFFIRFFKKGKE